MKKSLWIIGVMAILGAGCAKSVLTPTPSSQPTTLNPPVSTATSTSTAAATSTAAEASSSAPAPSVQTEVTRQDLDNLKAKINTINPSNLNVPAD